MTSQVRHFEINESSANEPFFDRIATLEASDDCSLLILDVSLGAWEKCSQILSRARAANLPALVRIHRNDWVCELDESAYLLRSLRDRDQLTLGNCIELLRESLPKDSLQTLEAESKIESKSFQEWMVASLDPRIHKYPMLPWRSFIRKVVTENYEFAGSVLDILFMVGSDAPHSPELRKLVDNFLSSKKKVLCIFPKRWGKS